MKIDLIAKSLSNVKEFIGRWLPDKLYVSLKYRCKLHKSINWNKLSSFNEKLQWLKLYDRKPEYTIYVDKYAVRDYIAKTIGEEYLIPLLGVWDTPEEINFDQLPNQFVLKCNHDSGGLCICKDKSSFDIEFSKKKLSKSLTTDYYLGGREWPYKNVPRKIIAEKYMVDESGYELKDYKIFCFNGEPKIIQVDFDRFTNHKRNIYDLEWKLLDIEIEYPSAKDHIIEKPKYLDEMLMLARTLSKDIPHVRTDFYCINDKIYFGEMTFYHESGFGEFTPRSADKWLGNKLDIGACGGGKL